MTLTAVATNDKVVESYAEERWLLGPIDSLRRKKQSVDQNVWFFLSYREAVTVSQEVGRRRACSAGCLALDGLHHGKIGRLQLRRHAGELHTRPDSRTLRVQQVRSLSVDRTLIMIIEERRISRSWDWETQILRKTMIVLICSTPTVLEMKNALKIKNVQINTWPGHSRGRSSIRITTLLLS